VTEMLSDPGLNLQFVDEALTLVREAEGKGDTSPDPGVDRLSAPMP